MTLIRTSLNLEGPGELYEDGMQSEFSRRICRYTFIDIAGNCGSVHK